MTELGEYLAKRSINKLEVSRKTVISKPRLSELKLNESMPKGKRISPNFTGLLGSSLYKV